MLLYVALPIAGINTACKEGYDLSHVSHALLSLSGDFSMDVNKGSATVRSWLDSVSSCKREAVSAAHLKIALQCGGSCVLNCNYGVDAGSNHTYAVTPSVESAVIPSLLQYPRLQLSTVCTLLHPQALALLLCLR